MGITYESVARMIDHALLKPDMTDDELIAGCELARRYEVASVCINPHGLRKCAEILAGSTVEPSTVIGFPNGTHTSSVKTTETEQAFANGATEVDMVVNIGKVRSGDWQYVRTEIAAVAEIAHASNGLVKVIFETCYLEDSHKIRLCQVCADVGVDFVKTSTGFGSGGATLEDVRLMREHTPPHIGVKASGGIRDLDRLLEFREIGAARIGASATAVILDDLRARLNA